MHAMTFRAVMTASILLIGAAVFWPDRQAPAPAAKDETRGVCTDRVFLQDAASYSWGSFTRWRGGHVTAFHVIDSGEVAKGPASHPVGTLPATDFAFLDGAPAETEPDSVPALSGRVTLEGFPARATRRETVEGTIYAPDTIPPGVWVLLDHEEPLVGGFSGGCVRNADGEVVAIIMGASSMRLDGHIRHFARVIPIRAALAEHQGEPAAAPPVSLMSKPLPVLTRWPGQGGIAPRPRAMP